jgi:hypothetical protein
MRNWRVVSPAMALVGVALLPVMGRAAPSSPALGANEALVCSEGYLGVIQVLDLVSGQVRDLPGAPVALARPTIMPSRQSFMYWQGGDSSPVVLWSVTLPATYRKLYTAPAGYTVIASTWWPAHYCVLSSFLVGNSGRLVMVPLQGVSRELRAEYDDSRGPVIPLGTVQSLVGLADGTHALVSSIGQAVRAAVDVNSGRGVPFGIDWPQQSALGWPWQHANLYWQDPRLNRADGRLYGTLLAYVRSGDQSLTPTQKADLLKALTASSGIYSCKPDGSDLRRVPVSPSTGLGANRFPVLVDLSPDGRQLLFCYYDYGVKGYAVPGLYLCHLDGSNSRAVAGAGTKLSTAAWGN